MILVEHEVPSVKTITTSVRDHRALRQRFVRQRGQPMTLTAAIDAHDPFGNLDLHYAQSIANHALGGSRTQNGHKVDMYRRTRDKRSGLRSTLE